MVDVFAASALLLLFLPMAILLAILIRRRGPRVGKRQEIIGLGGRLFGKWSWASEPDHHSDRLTRALLKELSFVPALINVLAGDMAIVGPEARSPRQHKALAHLTPDHARLLSMRPGLIGASATSGKLGAASQAQSEFDYVSRWRLKTDLRVICHRLFSYPLEVDSLGVE